MRESKNSQKTAEYIEKLLNYLFLNGMYKQRKFYVSAFSNLKAYQSINYCYNIIYANIKNLTLLFDSPEFNPYKLFNYIRLAQLHFTIRYDNNLFSMYKNYKELEKYPELKDFAYDLEFFPLFKQCEAVSKKFGLFICDLFDNPIMSKLTKKTFIINEADILPPFPQKESMFNLIDCSNFNDLPREKQEKIMNTLDYKIGIGKENRVTKSNFGKLLKASSFNKKFKSSLQSRIYGIWLWDATENPRTKNRMDFQEAIKILYKYEFNGTKQDIDIFSRYYRLVLGNTKQCINVGELMPYSFDESK